MIKAPAAADPGARYLAGTMPQRDDAPGHPPSPPPTSSLIRRPNSDAAPPSAPACRRRGGDRRTKRWAGREPFFVATVSPAHSRAPALRRSGTGQKPPPEPILIGSNSDGASCSARRLLLHAAGPHFCPDTPSHLPLPHGRPLTRRLLLHPRAQIFARSRRSPRAARRQVLR